jgi:hypothetical protein
MRGMAMRRQVGRGQRDCFASSSLAHCEIAPDMHRHAPAQVRQPEGVLTITAIGGPEQLKKYRVFGDREKLTIAGRPA